MYKELLKVLSKFFEHISQLPSYWYNKRVMILNMQVRDMCFKCSKLWNLSPTIAYILYYSRKERKYLFGHKKSISF